MIVSPCDCGIRACQVPNPPSPIITSGCSRAETDVAEPFGELLPRALDAG